MTKAEREWKFKGVFGFYPANDKVLVGVEKILKQKPLNECEEFMQNNFPLEYIKFINSKRELKVDDIVMTLRGGFSCYNGGRILRVYKITEQCIYTCRMGCENPEDETKCTIGDRFCSNKSEYLDTFIVVTDYMKGRK